MFDSLKDKFDNIFDALKGKSTLREDDIDLAMREIRRALLEADVNFKVVKSFIASVKEKAKGRALAKSLKPAELIYSIVYDELVNTIGSEPAPLVFAQGGKTIYMMVGLQGSGKTTTSVKIARKIAKSHKPLVVACDLRRPAAVEQLRVLAKESNIAFLGPEDGVTDAVEVAKRSLEYADNHLCDTIILDTAGRLQLDGELMAELERMKSATNPTEILLVVDSMTGQEAVNIADEFHKRLETTGVILTKLDGDSRGGPALAIKATTGVPIKLVGHGEKTTDLEVFDARRIAQRIIGMGDMEGLINKVQSATTESEIKKMTDNIKKNRFTMEDMLMQLQQVQRLGPLEKVLEMIPGAGKALKGVEIDPSRLKRTEAIILSMTVEERRNPTIIKGSRRKRIAQGSGTSVQLVNQVLAQFQQMKTMMKTFGKLANNKGKLKVPRGFGKGRFF